MSDFNIVDFYDTTGYGLGKIKKDFIGRGLNLRSDGIYEIDEGTLQKLSEITTHGKRIESDTSFKDFSYLAKRIKKGNLVLNPSYQRPFNSDYKHIEKKIRDILVSGNVPNNNIYIAEDSISKKYNVIDGQHRLGALYEFYTGASYFKKGSRKSESKPFFQFSNSEENKNVIISGISYDLSNKTYEELDETIQQLIEELKFHVINKGSLTYVKQIELFIALNDTTPAGITELLYAKRNELENTKKLEKLSVFLENNNILNFFKKDSNKAQEFKTIVDLCILYVNFNKGNNHAISKTAYKDIIKDDKKIISELNEIDMENIKSVLLIMKEMFSKLLVKQRTNFRDVFLLLLKIIDKRAIYFNYENIDIKDEKNIQKLGEKIIQYFDYIKITDKNSFVNNNEKDYKISHSVKSNNFPKFTERLKYLYNFLKTNIDYKNEFENLSSLIDKMVVLPENKKEFTKEQREEIKNKYNNKCSFYGCNVNKNLEIDHKIPKHLGGSNDIENGQLLCLEHHYDKTQKENKNREENRKRRNISLSDK